MKIIISGQHLKLFPQIESYAYKKAEKLAKFNKKIVKITLHLISNESHRDKEQDFVCEIHLDIPGKNLDIVDTELSMDKAIDKAVERMKRLLTKNKERNLAQKHKESLRKNNF